MRQVAATLGDEFELREYKRMTPLAVSEASLNGDLSKVQKGDAVVAFSRRDIYQLKLGIEAATGLKCCVVYGALPPETRRAQANLFNDPDSGWDVLVASDAIGMGLNLNIRRVVFASLHKKSGFGPDPPAPVPATLVGQIAGRAGRRGTAWEGGEVTTLQEDDLPRLKDALAKPLEGTRPLGVLPTLDQLEAFARSFDEELPFAEVLRRFQQYAQLDGAEFFLCGSGDDYYVCSLLDQVPGLTTNDRFTMSAAPVNSREPTVLAAMLEYAYGIELGEPVLCRVPPPPPPPAPPRAKKGTRDAAAEGADKAVEDVLLPHDPKKRAKALEKRFTSAAQLETKYAVLTLYLWLAQRFGEDLFPVEEREAAAAGAAAVVERLGETLKLAAPKGSGGPGAKPSRKQKQKQKRALSGPSKRKRSLARAG